MNNITELPKLNMFLAKPDKTTIGKLKHVTDQNLVIKSQEVSELSFTVPYYFNRDHKKTKNPLIDLIKSKYLIKVEFRNKTEWFVIDDFRKVSETSESLHVRAYSLPYQLQYHTVDIYEETSVNCEKATQDVLKNTDWTVGYVNPKFNTKYRRFEISSGTKLSSLYEIRDTFESVIVFDTINKTVSHYDEDEVYHYKGLNIGYGKYIQNIEEVIDAKEIVTRLYVYGSDGAQINSVNPTGQSYLDDFSYFIYPFEMNEKGEIITSSDYMSDSLAKSLTEYNKYVTENGSDFKNNLDKKSELQKDLTKENNKLVELENELTIILDAIVIAKENNESLTELNKKKKEKNTQIKKVKNSVKSLEGKISDVNKNILLLKENLKMENHLDEKQLEELSNFIQTDEWTNDNIFDVNDLYEAGVERIKEINKPPIDITTSLVNLLRMTSEKHNWDRINVNDIIKIDHEKLDIKIKTRITELIFDFEGDSISVRITDSERAKENQGKTIEELISESYYTIGKINTEFNKRKIDWNKTAYNFNIRNDRYEEIPVNPTSTVIKHKENDNGSVNLILNWEYPEYEKTKKKEHNIDGFIVYMHSSDTDEPYQFTSKMSEETLIPNISQEKRTYTITSVPSNLHYTIGVRAYRRVDDDINPEGILMSEIVGFNNSTSVRMLSRMAQVHNSVEEEYEEPYKSYQPNTEVNIKGKVNGANLKGGIVPPNNPEIGDIWFDRTDGSVKTWDGFNWIKDNSFGQIQQELDQFNKQMEELSKEIEETLEEANKELEEEMQKLEEEMKWLEEEVIPDVERAIEETNIPISIDPPEEIPLSGLWYDSSTEPPTLMYWDEEEATWNKLGVDEDDIKKLMEEMRKEAETNSRTYSKMEVIKTRKEIVDRLERELGDVHGKIEDLENLRDELFGRVEDIEEYVDELKSSIGEDIEDIGKIADELRELANNIQTELGDFEGRIDSVEQVVDEVNGYIGSFVESIERIDGEVKANKSSIEQNSEMIASKVDSIQYEEDKDGIINSIDANSSTIKQLSDEIELRVTKDELEEGLSNISTANLLTSSSSAWEHGDYSDSGVIENDNKSKIRLKMTSPSKLIANTDYTFSAGIAESYTSMGIDFWVSILHLRYEDLTTPIITRLVDRRLMDEPITFNSGEATFEVEGIEDNSSYIVLVLEVIQPLLLSTDSESLDSYKLMLNKGKNKMPYTFHDPDITERISNAEATLTIHADSIEQKAEKSELVNYVDKQEYSNKVGSLETSIDNITGRVEETEGTLDKVTGDIVEVSEKYAQLEIRADGIESEVSRVEEDVNGKISSANTQIQQNADSIKNKVDTLDYNRDKDGIISDITANRTEINQLSDEIELRVTKEEFENLEIGGRNLIPSFNDPRWDIGSTSEFTEYELFFPESYITSASIVIDVIPNTNYTFTFNSDYARYYIYKNSTGTEIIRTITEGSDVYTFNTLELTQIRLFINTWSQRLDRPRNVWNLKLERGNKATDWSPAPEDALERITKAEADIKINSEAIELKAEKSELTNFVDKQTYNNKIGQLDVSINGITGTVSDIKVDVDKNTKDITSANSKIAKVEQTADGIVSEVSNISADVDKAKQDITRVEQTAGRIESTVSSIDTRVNDIEDWEFGGRNLLLSTESWERPWDSIGTQTQDAFGGNSGVKTDASLFGYLVSYANMEKFKPDTYTFSMWVKSDIEFDCRFGYRNGTGTIYGDITIPTEWTRISFTFTTTNFTTEGRVVYWYPNGNMMSFSHPKLEKGNKATDWSPAPEDIDARMTATETTIKQLPDEIDLSVKEGLRGVGNLVKNPELTESTEGWNSGNGLRYMKVTYGEFDGTGALRSEAETNTQTYSEWFDVDPSKAYEVSMWVRKSATRGRWYLGVHGSDNPTGSANNLGFTTVNKFSGSPITNPSTNAYFVTQANNASSQWTKLTGYLMPHGTDPKDLIGLGENNQNNMIMSPNLKRMRIRWLNYTNGGTNTYMYVVQPKVMEVTSEFVGKSNILSSLNLSKEGVKIQGDKIDLQGLVTVLNADGSAGTMINGNKLITGSVIAEKLNVNEIFGNSAVIAKIQSDSVKTAELDAGKITAGTLNANRIGAQSITTAKLNAGAVTAEKIAANAITANKIAANAVTAGKIDVEELSAISADLGNITAGNIRGINIFGSKFVLDKALNEDSNIGLTGTYDHVDTRYGRPPIRYQGTVNLNSAYLSFRSKTTIAEGTNEQYHRYQITDLGANSIDMRVFRNSTNSSETGAFNGNETAISYSGREITFYRGGTSNTNTTWDTSGTIDPIYVSMPIISATEELHAGVGGRVHGESGSILRVGAGYIASMRFYDNTSTYTSNMLRVSSNGVVARSTSSRRYKLVEEPISLEKAKRFLNISAKTWYDKEFCETYADALNCQDKTVLQENYGKEQLRRIPGLIAEDLHDEGLHEYVEYDDEGRPDGISMYTWTPLLELVKDLYRKNERLEHETNIQNAQIKALKRRLEKLEDILL